MGSVTGLKVGQGRMLFVSATAESTFGSAAAITHNLIHAMDNAPLDITPDIIQDNAYSSGNLSDSPGRHLVTSYGFNGSVSVYATIPALGIFFAKAMANGTAGDTVTGTAAPVSHVLAYPATPNYLQGMTIEEHMNGTAWSATTDRKLCGVCVDSVEFTVGRTGMAKLNVGLIGAGTIATGTTISTAPITDFIAAPKVRLLMQAATGQGNSAWNGTHVFSGTAGVFPTMAGYSDLSPYLDNMTLRVSNGANGDDREAGSSAAAGIFRGQVLPRNRAVELEFTATHGSPMDNLIFALSNSTYATQNEYTFIVQVMDDTASGRGASFVVPLAALSEKPGGYTGGGPMSGSFKFRGRVCTSTSTYQPFAGKIVNAETSDYA